ncbi:MAG TPA: DUF3106 domain-containing protein [Rhodanobacteraceae bacterium]
MNRRLQAWLGATLIGTLVVMAPCALAQTRAAIPLQPGSPPALRSPEAPLPWGSLSPTQQRMLAPVRNQWTRMPAARQQHLAARAEHWAGLPPAHQQLIQQRLTRWAAMTPAQRRELRANARAFRSLPPAERARISAAYRRFQSLPPAKRRAMRERWRALPPDERMHWATEHPRPAIPMHAPGGHQP